MRVIPELPVTCCKFLLLIYKVMFMRQPVHSKIPLFLPAYGDEEFEAISNVIRSGWWGLGPKTREFEQKFAQFVGSGNAVSTNSATAALHLALKVAGVKGGEVLTTPFTFVSTNHAILLNEARPVFCDIDEETLNISVDEIVRKISSKTKAIVCVHFGGHPCDMNEIRQVAGHFGVPIIEDAAHAAGARYRDQQIGSGNGITCFSFHPVKNLATGDGGMITLGDPEVADRLRRLCWVGIDRNTWDRSGRYGKSYSWSYDVSEVGYKYHTNDIMSAIGLVQLKYLNERNVRRRKICDAYDRLLGQESWIQLPTVRDYVESSRHNYVIRTSYRDALHEWLAENGIESGVHYFPNHLYGLYQEFRETLPVVEREWLKVLSLPVFVGMTDEDVERVVSVIRRFKPRASCVV